jgi:hypothetical protein
MKRIGVLLCIGCLGASGLVSTSGVRAASGTTCTVENPVNLTPGLSLVEGSSGTFDNQTRATVSCDGPVKGVTPTGPGKMLDKGAYGTADPDDCVHGGEGTGAYTLILPTADGTKSVVLPFTLEFSAPSTNGGLVAVHTRGDGFVGEFGAVPTAGDCVSAPVTTVLVKGEIVLS